MCAPAGPRTQTNALGWWLDGGTDDRSILREVQTFGASNRASARMVFALRQLSPLDDVRRGPLV
jgi:hypothetical protein